MVELGVLIVDGAVVMAVGLVLEQLVVEFLLTGRDFRRLVGKFELAGAVACFLVVARRPVLEVLDVVLKHHKLAEQFLQLLELLDFCVLGRGVLAD